MHVTPEPAPQQSVVDVHLSPFAAQPEVADWHTPAAGALAPVASPVAPASDGIPASEEMPASGDPAAQKPPQQSVPVAHELPSPLHGGSDQNPRIARFVSSCPVR